MVGSGRMKGSEVFACLSLSLFCAISCSFFSCTQFSFILLFVISQSSEVTLSLYFFTFDSSVSILVAASWGAASLIWMAQIYHLPLTLHFLIIQNQDGSIKQKVAGSRTESFFGCGHPKRDRNSE